MSKKKEKKNDNFVLYLILPFVFLLGLGLGLLYKALFPSLQSPDFEQIRQQGYEYINPLIDFESVQSTNRREYVVLEKEIVNYISDKKASSNDITHISIYFKDLNTGAWIGIDEKEPFIPASLIKVPLMIALYKKEQENPGFLNQKLTFEYVEVLNQDIPPEKYLKENEQYSVDQLIDQLIIYSDNSVLDLLYSTISDKEGEDIFYELGLPNPYLVSGFEDSLDVKDYSSFFRILYNASYLNKELSSKALSLLASTQFDTGITAGVPSSIKVANKFGERTLVGLDKSEIVQIHDCAIVYYTPKPYLLCIMTKGTNQAIQTDALKEISEIVFQNISK